MELSHSKYLLTLLFALIFLSGCTKDGSDDDLPGSSNNLSLGLSANDLLSQDRFTALKLEVIYVRDFAPSPAALDDITSFLEQHTHKPDGIKLVTREISSPGGGEYTAARIKEIEDEYRSAYNLGTEIAVLILFLDGKSATQKDNNLILGTAYKNTSMVIYEETIRDLSEIKNIPRSEIESTTIKHEFGHLFGLVDNGSPAQSAHEDSVSKSHCNVSDCLMVASVAFGRGASQMLQKMSSQTIAFDSNCLNDLRANGGK